ncbi:MAG: hypothetical protein M1576_04230 [Deltaproteobacteria bacterium]|nr:hypothetical protein [Deltaproteobacteria bacterium]
MEEKKFMIDFIIVAIAIIGTIKILQLIGIIEKPKKRNTKNNYNKNKNRANLDNNHLFDDDDYSPYDYNDGINSATGLPMYDGIDIEGNPDGCNSSDDGSF